MNQYIKNLNKIEFVVTYACTGRCKHCSEGEHTSCGEHINPKIAACGVNDLLLSVDAFHQETIPLDVVKQFAAEAKACGIPIRLQPAWLRSAADDNPYNRKTREILSSFADMGISVN